jgi:hypothetical protein
MIAPISEVFSTQLTSIINGCNISSNIGVTPSFINSSIFTLSKYPYYPIDYIPSTYKDFVVSDSFILAQPQLPESIQVIAALLSIKNGTIVAGQDYFFSSIDSTVDINGLTFKNVMLTKDAFEVIQTTLALTDLQVSNITSQNGEKLIELSSGAMNITGLTYSNSTVKLLLSTFSEISMRNLHITQISGVKNLVSLRESRISEFYNSSFCCFSDFDSYAFEIFDSNITSIRDVRISNIGFPALLMKNNKVALMHNVTMSNCSSAFEFYGSEITSMTSSTFVDSGSANNLKAGSLYFEDSEFSIINSTFKFNRAANGGAINVKCSFKKACNSAISSSIFENNAASNKGGAIYYNSYRPEMADISFLNNSALYGDNIGSYAAKIVEYSTTNNKLRIENVPSGLAYNQKLKFALVDYDGQIMSLENSNVAKISSSTAGVSISGIDYAKFTNGIAEFSDIVFVGTPGLKNAEYFVSTRAIDSSIITRTLLKIPSDATDYETKLIANFRYCKPGEVQTASNTCRECSYGTYSLEWNSRV